LEVKVTVSFDPEAQKILNAIVASLKGAPAVAPKVGAAPALAVVPDQVPPKKRGRPTKEELAARAAAEAEPAPVAPKKGKKAPPVEVDEDEADEEEEEDEDEDEETEEEDAADEDEDDSDEEDELLDASELKKVKAALREYTAAHSKEKAVKILLKFAPTSDKVKKADVAKVLKALKVAKAA